MSSAFRVQRSEFRVQGSEEKPDDSVREEHGHHINIEKIIPAAKTN